MPGSRQARNGEMDVVPLLEREMQLASPGKYDAQALRCAQSGISGGARHQASSSPAAPTGREP